MAASPLRVCCHCGEQIPAADCCPWSSAKWCCHACKTNYNRQIERNSKDAALKKWWASLSTEAKIDWYKRNTVSYTPHKRHAFDDAGTYEEDSTTAKVSGTNDLYNYLPMDDWILRVMSLGKCGEGSLKEKIEVGKKLYTEAVTDKTMAKKWAGDQWCIGVFGGVQDAVGSEQREQQKWKRRKTIDDQVDMDAAMELAQASSMVHDSWIDAAGTAAAHRVSSSLEMPSIPEGLARNPERPATPSSDATGDIKREVLMKMQRDAKISDLQDQDDHEAKQEKKLEQQRESAAGAALGRPRKQLSELLTDLGKIVRDRKTMISDAVEAKQKEVAEALASVVKDFPEMPEGLNQVKETVEKEVPAAMVLIKEVETSLGALDLAVLAATHDRDSAALRKVIVDASKDVFGVHLTHISKSIAALKESAKKGKADADKASKRKGKRAAGGCRRIPSR